MITTWREVRPRAIRGSIVFAVAVLFWCAGATREAGAQVSGEESGGSRCVGVRLAPDHWAVAALRRLQALGAVREYTTLRTPDLCSAYSLLRQAVEDAANDEIGALAANQVTRLEQEFPGIRVGPTDDGVPTTLHLSLSAVAKGRDGAAAPGLAEFEPHRTGATPVENRKLASFEGDVGALTGRTVAFRIVPVVDQDRASLETVEGVLGLGPVALTLGRGTVGYGTAQGGGVVLGGGRFDRLQIDSRGTWNMPGPLRPLGRVGFGTFLAVLRESRHPDDSYFWGASGSLQPHWRATFYVHRGAMIRLDEQPLTARRLWTLLIGEVEGLGFENQVVSVEGRFHLPTERLLPLSVYLEWGAEDAAGAWWDVPGRIAGVEVPSVPGTPGLSLGLERASFAVRCCGNPGWYRHSGLTGGWVVNDRPLGHPLGGNGTEWLVFAGLDGGWRVRADARLFRRERGPDNLYTPGREGESWGAAARLLWRNSSGAEIFGDLEFEKGSGWRETRAALGGRWAFGR